MGAWPTGHSSTNSEVDVAVLDTHTQRQAQGRRPWSESRQIVLVKRSRHIEFPSPHQRAMNLGTAASPGAQALIPKTESNLGGHRRRHRDKSNPYVLHSTLTRQLCHVAQHAQHAGSQRFLRLLSTKDARETLRIQLEPQTSTSEAYLVFSRTNYPPSAHGSCDRLLRRKCVPRSVVQGMRKR